MSRLLWNVLEIKLIELADGSGEEKKGNQK